ncbi:redoxin domain-containing protein [Mycolicibacterium tokaiense]|nr:redoxin domain-containing protein [Mycolicibacterium tokaiense]
MTIGDTAPDFHAATTQGPIDFHNWIGDSWAVLLSHPRDSPQVCTAGYMAYIKPEFDARNTRIIGLSVDPVDNHTAWAADIADTQGTAPKYPMISDHDYVVATAYGMLPAGVTGDPTSHTPAELFALRDVFISGPDKVIKLVLIYPLTTGRNFEEVLRVLDTLRLTAAHKVATPAQWNPGDDVIVAGSVSDEQAAQTYPDGWRAPLPYLRLVSSPIPIPS